MNVDLLSILCGSYIKYLSCLHDHLLEIHVRENQISNQEETQTAMGTRYIKKTNKTKKPQRNELLGPHQKSRWCLLMVRSSCFFKNTRRVKCDYQLGVVD
jgi:carboxypeptidase C (cathepsin A)